MSFVYTLFRLYLYSKLAVTECFLRNEDHLEKNSFTKDITFEHGFVWVLPMVTMGLPRLTITLVTLIFVFICSETVFNFRKSGSNRRTTALLKLFTHE